MTVLSLWHFNFDLCCSRRVFAIGLRRWWYCRFVPEHVELISASTHSTYQCAVGVSSCRPPAKWRGVLFWSYLSVCQTITFESLDVGSSHLHMPCTTGHVYIEGHRVKVKVTAAKQDKNSYSRNVQLRSAITPILSNIIEPWCLHAAWGFRVRQMKWCDRHLCHVTGSEHA